MWLGPKAQPFNSFWWFIGLSWYTFDSFHFSSLDCSTLLLCLAKMAWTFYTHSETSHDVINIPFLCEPLEESRLNVAWIINTFPFSDPQIVDPKRVMICATSKMQQKKSPAQPFMVRLRNFQAIQTMEHFPCKATRPFNPGSDEDMETDPMTGSWLVCHITCTCICISHMSM